MLIVFASLQHVKLPVSVKIAVTIWQNVYSYVTALATNLMSWTAILLTWYLHSCKGNRQFKLIIGNILILKLSSDLSTHTSIYEPFLLSKSNKHLISLFMKFYLSLNTLMVMFHERLKKFMARKCEIIIVEFQERLITFSVKFHEILNKSSFEVLEKSLIFSFLSLWDNFIYLW